RRVGGGEVDRPGVGGWAAVRIAGDVSGADVEAVAAFGQRGGGVRVGAGAPAAAVDAALEARAGLARAEAEAGGGVVGRVGGAGVQGCVGRGDVDRPGDAGRASVRVAGRVGGADVERVRALCQS